MKAALRSFAFLIAAIIFLPSVSSAQTTGTLFRSYLSAKGVDTNPCTVDAPCRLLPAALAATQSGGEVWIVDSANYNTGAVQITQSVTILAVPGALGSFVANNADAIDITAANVIVTMRNLVVRNLAGSENDGVYLSGAGAQLIVEGSEFSGLFTALADYAAGSYVSVSNSTFRTNNFAIDLETNSATNYVTGVINQCTILGFGTTNISSSATGAYFYHANVTVNNTVMSNTLDGIFATSSTVLLNSNVITKNAVGLYLSGASVQSTGKNTLDNTTNVSGGSITTVSQY